LFDFVKVDGTAAVGLVETVKKPSVVGAAFSSRGGNPRFVRISIQRRQFPQASFGLLFCVFLFIAFFLGDFQVREENWVIADLIGKGKHIRTVPVPA
jgi:hypothetical protein